MEQVKKILIIGSKGMAGHIVYHYFKASTSFITIDIARDSSFHIPTYELDVSDLAALEHVVSLEKPDFVVNCVGVLNKSADENPEIAVLLNSYFPHYLAKLGGKLGFKVIHISTDCVFSGKHGNYAETSVKDGVGMYAQTKSIGELNYGNNLTIRTSIIGPELKGNGIGLFDWFMKQSGDIKGYSEAYWTGVTTLELAKAIHAALAEDLSGLVHLVNGNKISKYHLLKMFAEVFSKDDLAVIPFLEYKVDKSLLPTKSGFDYAVPEYREMLEMMKTWILNHNDLYSYKL